MIGASLLVILLSAGRVAWVALIASCCCALVVSLHAVLDYQPGRVRIRLPRALMLGVCRTQPIAGLRGSICCFVLGVWYCLGAGGPLRW